MIKRKHIKWILLGIYFSLLVWFAASTIPTLVLYPNFQKELRGYKSLQHALLDCPEKVYLPELSELLLGHCTYSLILDGQNISARPKGYCVYGTHLCDSAELHYNLYCSGITLSLTSPDQYYRGVPLQCDPWSFAPAAACGVRIRFLLGSRYYSFGGYYYYDGLPSAEKAALDSTLKTQAFALAQQVIDAYLDA